MPELHVATIGNGPRVVFVHGSGNAGTAWDAQRDLADRYTLVLPIRSGYPPNPPLERIDFQRQAEELAPLVGEGAHLVGHSYGGVIALLVAAAAQDRVRSLVVSEPPLLQLAPDEPAAAQLVAELTALFADPGRSPLEHASRFIEIVGVEMEAPPSLTEEEEAVTRAAMAERPPWEAQIPFAQLRAAPFPKLVLSGGHNRAFEAVCDVLEERLGARRAVLPGKGHGIPRAPGYNETLDSFFEGGMISLPLETARLRIRPFRPAEDAEPLHELWGDPEAMRFVRPGREATTPDETRARLEDIVRRSVGWGFWAVEERAGGRAVGGAGLFPLEWKGPEIELAYHVVPSRWGCGYATEAGAALLAAAWRETDLDHVVAVAFPDNRASTRVMEKLGMDYEGTARYGPHEVVRYSIARPRGVAAPG